MERSERIGLTVSAAGHGGLILLALIGGIFNHQDMSLPVTTTEVSLISSDEFAALQARAPTAPTESPAVPSAPAEPTAADQPRQVEEAPPPAAQPEPEAQPVPDAAPDVTDLTPPEPEASPAEPVIETPPVEVPSDTVLETISPRPRPTDAPRIAPAPADTPAPDASPAETVATETAPVPDEAAPPQEQVQEQAPEAATTQTPVENDTAEVTQSSAPLSSPRPKSRPAKPAPAPEPQVAAADTAKPAAKPSDQTEAALNDALAEALSGAQSDAPAAGTGTAASGPPLTSGEKDAMRVAVKQCWVVDNGAPWASVVVTIGFEMSPDGRVVDGSLRMVDAQGGDENAQRTAFEAGRRAILRCQKQGYPLPPEKYEQWRRTEIVFDPSKMRLR